MGMYQVKIETIEFTRTGLGETVPSTLLALAPYHRWVFLHTELHTIGILREELFFSSWQYVDGILSKARAAIGVLSVQVGYGEIEEDAQ